MKTIITTNNQNTNSENNFTTLLRAWETVTTDSNATENEKTETLQTLATACALSVLKKLYNVSAQKTIKSMQLGILQDIENLKRIEETQKELIQVQMNILDIEKDKKYLRKIGLDTKHIEPVLKKAKSHRTLLNRMIIRLLQNSFSEGYDLINTAVVSILEETQKALDRIANGETYEHETNIDKNVGMFMEYAFPKRQLKKKVLIKDEHNANCYEYKPTTPIQEVYKAIRREIENNRAVQIANNKYIYIEVDNNNTEEKLYKRLPKYSGLASETYSSTYSNYGQSAKAINTTASTYDVDRVEKIIAKLNLSERQTEVLQLRLRGYGYRAISTYLGIDIANTKRVGKQIQKKCTDIGFTPYK